MSKVEFEHLFSPIKVGPMLVPNRICETTNTINSSQIPGEIDENYIAHHAAKARGGTGWIGSETWLLHFPFPRAAPDEVGLSVGFAAHQSAYQNPAFLEGMKKFIGEVHDAGSVAIVQLTHLSAVWAPSEIPAVGAQDHCPHELGDEEIEAILDIYGDAAAAAKACGADAIEVHCAHETLGYTFLSPVTNQRTDKWGGGPQERIRFVVEALKKVRDAPGKDVALGIRMSGKEFRKGGFDNIESREMTYYIGETGLLDFVSVDVGHCWGSPSYVPSSYFSHGEFRECGKAVRADLGDNIKVLFAGRVNDPVIAEEMLQEGYCDLIGMVRAGIADAEFANKAREGRLGEIRRCISCTRCIDEASEPMTFPYKPRCSINPVIGNEVRWKNEFKPAEKSKRVVVVGGGLAGCEAARIATERGHKVTLFEQGKRLGGQLNLAARASGRDDFEDQIYFEENEMERLGVDVKLRTDADVATIKALSPEAVVIATGAVPRVPHDVVGLDLPHVVQGWDAIRGTAEVGQRVAIVSQEDYYETPTIAEYLAQKGKDVEVFTKSTQLGFEIARYSVAMVLAHMENVGVKVTPNLVLNEIKSDGLEFVSSFGGHKYRKEAFDSVVLIYGQVPVHGLYDQLVADGDIEEVYIAGSAWIPRFMAEATEHGASIGLTI